MNMCLRLPGILLESQSWAQSGAARKHLFGQFIFTCWVFFLPVSCVLRGFYHWEAEFTHSLTWETKEDLGWQFLTFSLWEQATVWLAWKSCKMQPLDFPRQEACLGWMCAPVPGTGPGMWLTLCGDEGEKRVNQQIISSCYISSKWCNIEDSSSSHSLVLRPFFTSTLPVQIHAFHLL